ILAPHKSEVGSSGKQKWCPHLRNPTDFPNIEDNMDVKDVFKPQEDISCLRDLSGNGDNLIHSNSMASVTAGKAEECCSREVGSCPANMITSHPGNCCCDTEDSVSGQSLADVQAGHNPGTPLPTDTLIHEQADAPSTGERRYCVKDASDNPATVGGVYPEQIPSVSGDFDDDLEYFECSDVLTVHEDEIWKRKLQFLLESDDEDDLKLSKDCDGCAYFLGEMPCLIQVSDNTTPMDTTIGFCGHHSKLKGVNVRRDPSTYSQSTLQPEMTLTVGHHRDNSSSLQDKEKSKVPEASAAVGNDHPRAEEGNNGSGQSAADFPRDTSKHQDNVPAEADSAGGRGAALTKQAPDSMAESTDKDLLGTSSLLLEKEGGDVPEENTRHAVCTLTESLRRNLFKFLNPKELCRYVTALGQSLQAAAELSESSALGQEGITATGSPEEAESSQTHPGLCRAEERERKRTWGLSEHNQMPAETDSPRYQGADVQISAQNCERLCMEPQMEKEGISGTCESAGAIQPASEMLCIERTSKAKSDDVQTDSQHHDKGGSCHQQVVCEQGITVISDGASPFPLCHKQECLCAVLSSAKLCDEPRERGQQCSFDSHGSNDTDTFCSFSSDECLLEAHPKPGLECGEPVCSGDADISAVHDKLWQLLHEDEEPDYQIPCETRGITSLEIRLTGTKAPDLHCAQKTSSDPPLPVDLIEEKEPVAQPDRRQRTETGDCIDSNILLKADGASIGNTCLAEVVEADGVRLDSITGNTPEAPSSVCFAANNIILNPRECVEQEPNPTLPDSSGSSQMAVAGEGELPVNHASQACDAGSPGGLKDAQSGDRDKETPCCDMSDKSHGTVDQLLHTEHDISLRDESVSGERCHSRDSYPARQELPDFPEEKAIFPSGNTGQLPHEEHSLVNSLPESYGESLPEKENHSALKAQSNSDPDSDLPSGNDCHDSQVVSNAQENVTVIETPESITHKNPPQTTDQLPELETQGVAFTSSPGDVVLRDLDVEGCKAGGEQREIRRAGASCASGAGHVSGRQAAAAPHSTSEPHLGVGDSPFKSDGELKPEPIKWKPNTAKSGHVAAGAKKKLPPATLSKKPRLEERGDACRDPACATKPVRSEAGVSQREERKLTVKKESKAPKLLKGIQAELFPDCSGNIKLCCQFGHIHSDSTITWTKDSKLLARLQRSAQDDSPVSLAIAKASNKDQGMYYCCLNNMYGKVTAEFNLTSEVLEHLSSLQNCEGMEEIEFMQLMFREDFISDSYFGGNLRGVIATEELHFGEGMHRKAFRSRVMQGLVPVFSPGHPCVLKVHNAITYGTKSQDDLVEKNYNLALQECYVQNTAREYAKIYAAEAEPLEGFGEVPEIIPIFLVHRPANNIPYATVEEELVGEFVKYSVRDGKEVNFLRRDTEAGQKCCTFQHWVYEKTNGSLLVTDLQGVGMKLTDVGIATLAKGYKGFKGNCSISFIEQFRALHQCNKYCEMLGLKSLRTSHQKQRKTAALKSKTLPNSSSMKKTVPKKAREPRDFIASEH
ncbi:PREDICTED: alpha-protein kinase 2, partial [Nestor notabilis]|uniref:alpha-protein kinase 2 n=1 Tax=Nestor notabilis TaxID=176057 RepID=UPI000523212E